MLPPTISDPYLAVSGPRILPAPYDRRIGGERITFARRCLGKGQFLKQPFLREGIGLRKLRVCGEEAGSMWLANQLTVAMIHTIVPLHRRG